MNVQYEPQKGFTLAEVLITLLIIGVVASLVIPAVINDTNEAEYNVGVKKAQAALSNAIKMIQVNNGGSVNVGITDSVPAYKDLRNEFCNVMTCVKIDGASNIFGPIYYKYYKSSNSPFSADYTTPAAQLNNGNLIVFLSYGDCNHWNINACGYVEIDINGRKGPNMYGKDFYPFWIVRHNGNGVYSILPWGTQNDSFAGPPNGCTPGSTGEGRSGGCTAKRLYDPENMP